jgi:hypothetical protein
MKFFPAVIHGNKKGNGKIGALVLIVANWGKPTHDEIKKIAATLQGGSPIARS